MKCLKVYNYQIITTEGKGICFSFSTPISYESLARTLNIKVARASFDLLAQADPEALKSTVFPNTYATTMIDMPQGIALCPMRYRLRPFDSVAELPSKYNLYNARVEGIMEKKTWSHLVGKKHVAVPLHSFHEWVPTEKGKKVVQFSLKDSSIFWVAGLFDIFADKKTNEKIISFALVTQAPNDYVLSVGHDRCPIILDQQEAFDWIKIKSPKDAMTFLHTSRNYDFTHEWQDPLFSIAQQVKIGQNNH